MDEVKVAIVGSGPAGISAALSLHKLAPDLAARSVVLEKARHPRHKLCGGGVTLLADPSMAWLDIGWERLAVPHVPIHTAKLRFEDREVALRLRSPETRGGYRTLFRITRRNEFDARLVEIARERGIQVLENTAVSSLQAGSRGVLLETSAGSLRAQVVVGADGAKSAVRRSAGLPKAAGPSPVSRLLEVLTPEDAETAPEFAEGYAVFDFTPAAQGVQGYLWDFPSYVDGKAAMNRGIFDSRVRPDRPRAELVPVLEDYLRRQQRSLADCRLMGHPERYYDPQGTYAVPRILLAGDAAGVDPLLGEGIAWALRYGPVVAGELRRAFATGDFSFAGYSQRLRASTLGRELTLRVRLARMCYGRSRRFIRLAWPLIGPVGRYVEWRTRNDGLDPQR